MGLAMASSLRFIASILISCVWFQIQWNDNGREKYIDLSVLFFLFPARLRASCAQLAFIPKGVGAWFLSQRTLSKGLSSVQLSRGALLALWRKAPDQSSFPPGNQPEGTSAAPFGFTLEHSKAAGEGRGAASVPQVGRTHPPSQST